MSYDSETQYPWLNVIQYPFATREFDTGDGWMSYVDSGRGRPVVFLHGNVTWSFLYRHLIRGLEDSCRCIAPDMLGFGLSDKPRKVDYRPVAQAKRFADLMDYLRLDDVTLVLNCAGGPVGLSWAIENPHRVRDLVLTNTWMWPLNDNRPAMRLAHLVSNPFNHLFYRWLKASPAFVLPSLFGDRHCFSRTAVHQYMEPFRNYHDRHAVYAMVEALHKSRGWFQALWERREAIADKRALLLWGSKDPVFGDESLQRFEELFSDRHTVRIPICGRFVPEEAPMIALEEMRWFLASHSLSNTLL